MTGISKHMSQSAPNCKQRISFSKGYFLRNEAICNLFTGVDESGQCFGTVA